MKKLLTLAFLGSALVLTACGGSSNSSGHANKTDTSKTATPKKKENIPISTSCKTDGKSIVLVTKKGCTYSNPRINNGAKVEFKCTPQGGVTGMGGMIGAIAGNIEFNGTTFKCGEK